VILELRSADGAFRAVEAWLRERGFCTALATD